MHVSNSGSPLEPSGVVFAAYTTLSQASSSLPKLKDHCPALFPEQTDEKAEAREGHATLRSCVIDRTEP